MGLTKQRCDVSLCRAVPDANADVRGLNHADIVGAVANGKGDGFVAVLDQPGMGRRDRDVENEASGRGGACHS